MLTDDEIHRRYQAITAGLEASFKNSGDKMDDLSARIRELEQTIARRNSFGGGGGGRVETWGQSMIDSDDFKSFAKTKGRGTVRIEVKTTLMSSGGANNLVSVDQRVDPIVIPRRRLRIRDLLSKGNTTSNSIRYVQQTSRDVHGAVQSEGFPKREGTMNFESETANVATIAVWIPASKQILDDAPALMALIDAELRYGVDYEEEQQILLGDGTGENLLGLIPSSTAYSAPFTPEAPTRIDAILLAQTQLELADLEATGVALNPKDWGRIRSTKDSEGNYIAGGPLTGAPRQLWDLPVVSSNSIPATKFLEGDYARAALLLERETTAIEVSTEHSDFFTRNLVAIRAEKRVALVLNMPSALLYGTFQATT